MLRRHTAAAVSLVAQMATAVALPAAHVRLHDVRGSGHSHGMVAPVSDREMDDAAAHRAFEEDLEALDLAEVARAGALEVDCSLASYTMVSCEGALPAEHARNFGDL